MEIKMSPRQQSPESAPRHLPVRRMVQTLFFIICLFMGLGFYLFVSALEQGQLPQWSRPAGVEGFLPISALLSLRYLLETGIFSDIHPAGLSLFLIICGSALLVKKGFCAWICPVGFLSDGLAKLNRSLFKRPLYLPTWPDRLLGLVKYSFLAFFIYTIFFGMPSPALAQFINSPYNQFADVKMLKFFLDISPKAAMVTAGLVLATLVIPHFWCRYLCPYGALLGLVSLFGLGRVKRNPETCIECGKCQRHCPGRIRILEKEAIHSTECSACLTCVQVCPRTDAIGFHPAPGAPRKGHAWVAITLLLLFGLGIGAAKLTGLWETRIPLAAYERHLNPSPKGMSMPGMSLPTDPEKRRRMMKKIMEMQKRKMEMPPS